MTKSTVNIDVTGSGRRYFEQVVDEANKTTGNYIKIIFFEEVSFDIQNQSFLRFFDHCL